MSTRTSSAIKRRTILGIVMLGGTSALLSACGSSSAPSSTAAPTASNSTATTSAPTSAPATKPPAATEKAASSANTPAATPTPAAVHVASGKPLGEVRFLCRSDIVTAYGAEDAIKRFMESHAGSKVTLDKPPQGADLLTKLRAAIASNSLVWDGYAVVETPWNIPQWADAQVIAPLDDLIRSSTEPDAAKLLPAIIPTIKQAIQYKGKVYSIPGNVGSSVLQWYWEPLKAVGYDKQPATWDETYDAAKKIKAKYGDKWIPMAFNAAPLCSLFTLTWAATPPDQLFKNGLINIQGQGAIDALNWMKKMVKEGLMLPNDKNSNEDWDRKTVAMLLSYDVKGEGAQKTYGYDAADTGVNIYPKAGEINSGAPFWMNGSVVLNKAKNPQGMMDFYAWWFGPSNLPAQKVLVATAAKPCYSYTYEKIVKNDPKFQWQQVGIDLVSKSMPFPANTYFNIEMGAIGPWEDKFLAPDSSLSAEQAMKSAAQDVQDKIQAQQG